MPIKFGPYEMPEVESDVYRAELGKFVITVIKRGGWRGYVFHGDDEIANASSNTAQFTADFLYEQLNALQDDINGFLGTPERGP